MQRHRDAQAHDQADLARDDESLGATRVRLKLSTMRQRYVDVMDTRVAFVTN